MPRERSKVDIQIPGTDEMVKPLKITVMTHHTKGKVRGVKDSLLSVVPVKTNALHAGRL